MNEQDRKLVEEIVDAFISKGLVPKRGSLGGSTSACALGCLVHLSDRLSINLESVYEELANRYVADEREAVFFANGIWRGFDGKDSPSDELGLRGYAIGAEVWRLLHCAPQEPTRTREVVR